MGPHMAWQMPSTLAIKKCYMTEHKVDIARQGVSEGGMKLKKEVHGGARKRTVAAILAKRAPGCTVPPVDSDFE